MMKAIKRLLTYILIIQEVSNDERHRNGLKRLGRGYSKAHRLNPYNPLSYIFFVFIAVFCILHAAGIEIIEIYKKNIFKWD